MFVKKQLSIRCFKSKQSLDCIFSLFPDACVWGKHSAWQSAHHRAEARTHYPQKHGAQKPSSGRKGDQEVVEGARVTFSLREFYCHALSLSQPTYSASLRGKFASQTLLLPAPSRREPAFAPSSAYINKIPTNRKLRSVGIFLLLRFLR